MRDYTKFYIDGAWVDPAAPKTLDVINPATEEVCGVISMGSEADVDKAVRAARKAFASFSQTSREERIDILERIVTEYQKRFEDMAKAITEEMGAPAWLAQRAQAAMGIGHVQTAAAVLKSYKFEEDRGTTRIVKEPIGVCAFITPWNWPVNQIACKVGPAIATGCTMVLKPSEIAPFSGYIWTEILHAAGVPAGVFNLVNGDGPTVGAAMSSHPEVDMVSFTGSTRAGIEVAKNAAPTVKRVHQELGGKSPNIILDDADFQKAVAGGVALTRDLGNTPPNVANPAWMAARTTFSAPMTLVLMHSNGLYSAMGTCFSAAAWTTISTSRIACVRRETSRKSPMK